jgi:hypothetical protein
VEQVGILELVIKIQSIEKCRKCECMKETLLSIREALQGADRDQEMEVFLVEVEAALGALLESEYT